MSRKCFLDIFKFELHSTSLADQCCILCMQMSSCHKWVSLLKMNKPLYVWNILRVSLYLQREVEYKKDRRCDNYEETNLGFAYIMYCVGGAEGCHSKSLEKIRVVFFVCYLEEYSEYQRIWSGFSNNVWSHVWVSLVQRLPTLLNKKLSACTGVIAGWVFFFTLLPVQRKWLHVFWPAWGGRITLLSSYPVATVQDSSYKAEDWSPQSFLKTCW